MKKSLRALVVEDSDDDTALLLHELRRAGYDITHSRVETAESMSRELASQTWDIVFSDFSMPRFNAFAALKMLHSTELDLPFIIVSGTIGEDRAVTAMKAGAHDYILKGSLKRLVPAVERELREARMRQQRRQAEETIHRLAYTDPITGLPNRTKFRELVQDAVQTSLKENHSLALLLTDLNNFKDVNDTLGHDRGDSLLQQVGQRMRRVLFAPDVVARLGGDEFGILLPRLAASWDVRFAIKKLRDCMEEPFMVDGIPIAVESSIGVATLPEHADSADTLLQRADIAMYRAKRMASGYAVYTDRLNRFSHERLGLMAQLRNAIDQHQLLLNFQPKLEFKTGQIVGAEALVRWQHPQQGMIMPDKFILAAEQTGLINPLTRSVLTDALINCQHARSDGIQLRMSVNLSARSLHDPQLPKMISEVLKTTGAEPDHLMLEITESAIVLDPISAEENLTVLNQMGIKLSIDDFGTGYTSLASIKRLPVDEIKIDKTFVTNMLVDRKDIMIVRTIIEFGHNFGLKVVAEGIETKEVFDALADLGCDEAQGYLISKPITYEALKIWLSTSPYKTASP